MLLLSVIESTQNPDLFAESPSASNPLAQILTIVIMLAFVLALIFILTKLMSGLTMRSGSGKNLQVIERSPLTRDTSMQLVRISGRYFVLGVGTHAVTKIVELGEDEIDLSAANAPKKGFSNPFARNKKENSDTQSKNFSLYLHSMQDIIQDQKENEDENREEQ